jgi:chemotaxis protein CheZ
MPHSPKSLAKLIAALQRLIANQSPNQADRTLTAALKRLTAKQAIIPVPNQEEAALPDFVMVIGELLLLYCHQPIVPSSVKVLSTALEQEVDFPYVSLHLKAIESSLEQSTQKILEAVDKITAETMAAPDAMSAAIAAHITQILEACNFEDIATQRLRKIASVVELLQQHLSAVFMEFSPLMEMLQSQQSASEPAPVDLLAGPQLPEKGLTQADIDALLGNMKK